MAGLKKKKKEKSGSPNVVLVVFLVLFVLTSIGLGVWAYSLTGEQKALRDERLRQKAAADSAKITADYYSMLWRELRIAIAGDKLDPDEKALLETDQSKFQAGEAGAFKNEKYREPAKQFKDEITKSLTLPDGKQASSFIDELKNAQTRIRDIEAKTKAEVDKHEETKKLLVALTKKQDVANAEIRAIIKKENDAALDKAKELSEEAKKIFDSNLKLNQEIAAAGEEKSKLTDEYEKVLKAKDRQIRDLIAENKENAGLAKGDAGGGGGKSMPRGELFPLLLDISPGKPLWDQPVGRIIRVDLDLRQVVINVGEAHGAKPELTFNVFGPNAAGKAEKQMKGTIEIVKVLDSNSSLCRITSLYDSEGSEILMNLQTRGRILRETEAPMKDGDLLFNLFWGTRVAIAGYVSITGERVDNPAQQFRQLDDFMALCKRNGMIVDAYVDMRDGQIRGKINAKTRYLIRGDDLTKPGKREAAPLKKEGDPDMPEKKDEGGLVDRFDQVNRSNYLLRNDAKEKGLLLISAENFATVIGYRKARSANSVELSGFRPMLPVAGAADGGVRVLPDRQPEKEAPKEKEMEKEKKDPGN